jgi:hypothetical protein
MLKSRMKTVAFNILLTGVEVLPKIYPLRTPICLMIVT